METETLVPLYPPQKVNEPVLLYEGPGDLEVVEADKRPWPCRVQIWLDWLPQRVIRLDITVEDPRGLHAKLRIKGFQGEVETRFYAVGSSNERNNHLRAYLPEFKMKRQGYQSDELACLSICVANFPDYHLSCSTDPSSTSSAITRELVMDAPGWRLTLDIIPKIPEHFYKSGGFALTHVGWLERTDGQTFNLEQAEGLIRALGSFLTFARGASTGAVTATGFSQDGIRAWDWWRALRVDSYDSNKDIHRSWFPDFGSPLGFLDSAWEGFLACWENDEWKEVLYLAIDRYALANLSDGPDSLQLTQTALEALAGRIAPDHKAPSKKGSRKPPASERIRCLLSCFKIPLEIPPILSELRKAAQDQKWKDGPHAFTKLRNDIVHHKPENPNISPRALHEAKELGLWYLELSLLALMGYRGKYRNRLKIFDPTPSSLRCYEPVPWAPEHHEDGA